MRERVCARVCVCVCVSVRGEGSKAILINSSLEFSMTLSNLLAPLSLILSKTVSNSRLRMETNLLIKKMFRQLENDER